MIDLIVKYTLGKRMKYLHIGQESYLQRCPLPSKVVVGNVVVVLVVVDDFVVTSGEDVASAAVTVIESVGDVPKGGNSAFHCILHR